ncbi:diguanylate cyclase [Mesobacillus zeae]|uniref:Diguanylate cyclase n=1 Tax=Mesobacillus zeae TaxID=1917180 RepID=A0A398AZU5_9BACI|nr:diguanylate cyclase [Mesobacillus zeae]RID83117.1 diguanylate cyclase [Mesobacillus zeae]
MNNIVEQLVLSELKCRFLDIILDEKAPLSRGRLVRSMLATIKDAAAIQGEIDFYSCGQWNKTLYLEATTRLGQSEGNIAFVSCSPESILNSWDAKVYRTTQFPHYGLVLVLKREDCLLGITAFEDPSYTLSDGLLENIADECSKMMAKIHSVEKILAEEQRYRQLHRVTEKFHSTMDMDDVLFEIIFTLRDMYPGFEYYLLLSHDNNSHGELPVKDLEYNSNNFSAMQAYVTGTIQLEDSLQERKSILYAPLKGRQGVYGVLQVIASNALVFPENEMEFISLLANTAGSALENAQLYQQSRRLVTDLQLINETSHKLNSNLRLFDTVKYVSGQILNSFCAQEVGFIMMDETAVNMEILQGSTEFFFSEGAPVHIARLGGKIMEHGEPFFIGDNALSGEHAGFLYKSIMGVPIVQNNHIKGFALVLHEKPYTFTFDAFKLLQSLIHHSSLAFANSMLKEQLEKMVITDHLTKLFSRSYLDEEMNVSMLKDEQGAFILIDIDNFKSINDTYGHQTGDDVLIQLARLVSESIRSSDIGARWGGEELAIYLPGAPLETGARIAGRLAEKAARRTRPGITISCGVSRWTKGCKDTTGSLFRRADQALYEAKTSGKNKVVVSEEKEYRIQN